MWWSPVFPRMGLTLPQQGEVADSADVEGNLWLVPNATYHSKVIQTGWLKITEMDSLIVLRTAILKGISRDTFPEGTSH